MRIGIPRESDAKEARVAATPATVTQLIKLGFEVMLESGTGERAGFSDDAYDAAQATVVTENAVWQSDIILKINAPTPEEISHLKQDTLLISFIWPAQHPGLLQNWLKKT